MSAPNISFKTALSPKAFGMILRRRRSSTKRRSSKFVVRIPRRCVNGKRRWAMGEDSSAGKNRSPFFRSLQNGAEKVFLSGQLLDQDRRRLGCKFRRRSIDQRKDCLLYPRDRCFEPHLALAQCQFLGN